MPTDEPATAPVAPSGATTMIAWPADDGDRRGRAVPRADVTPAHERPTGRRRPAGGDWAPEPAGGWGDAPAAAMVDDSAEYALPVEEHRDSLDDDAFFASLREAVRDDAPLGPRDERGFYDQDDAEDGRKLFRRKR